MKTTLIRGLAGELDWALNPTADLSSSARLLEAVAEDPEIGRIVRLYRPAPTVAFSGIEKHKPRFREAVAESVVFGFEPVIRPSGGRMVAIDQQWFVLDVITPEQSKAREHINVYNRFGASIVELLRDLGVEANFGPVAGEYCPGEHSVNARDSVKLVGTAQRVRRGARLFSACIPFEISADVAALFGRVNALLDLDWRPETLGWVSAENPKISADDLEAALLQRFAADADADASLADVFSNRNQLAFASLSRS